VPSPRGVGAASRRPWAADAESGSAMILMPAAVLIMVVLGALAVDSAIAFLGEREVANAAAAAANDAAGAAIDLDEFYTSGAIVLSPERAQQVATASVNATAPDFLDAVDVDVSVSPAGDAVEVTVTATVRYIFAPALPGASPTVQVQATAIAHPEEAGPG